MRKARFGQAALMIAGFLAVASSFGLHPEPEASQAIAAVAAAKGWNALDRIGETNPHVCVACLSQRSISLPLPAAVVLLPASAVTRAADAIPSRLGRLELQPREGRAPPVLL